MIVRLSAEHHEPIAIIGIGCRFPGGVSDPAGFWQLLSEGRDAITKIPEDRFDLRDYYDERPAQPGRVMTRWGGFLEHLDEMDAAFFGISPLEAERLDPQQRLLLETAWEALEDAGQDTAALAGSRTGVFIGQWLSDFEARLFAQPETVDFYMTTGSGRYASSGRLSYALGLRGPSLTLDSACSSSLAAIHLAVRSIRSGESRLALAGGTNVILQPHISIAYSQSKMMAPDGHCKFGDASGDGYVRSEGAALVALKPLDRAVADGDRIYAVIRGSALNNDGRSSGSMGTPSRIGQEELLRSAYDDAGVDPAAVGYVEAHGTGTRAGDPVELGALGAVLGAGRPAQQRVVVGSVKTNIGHTEGAAGVAGLIKATLALHHGAIPRSLHFATPNPAIAWDNAAFEVAAAARPWPDAGEPRFAGVSAFGIAGTNAHVVLEAAPQADEAASSEPVSGPFLLPLSARSDGALRVLAQRHADRLSGASNPALADVCWSAATRRSALEQRAAFVAADATSMVDALHAYSLGANATAEGTLHATTRPRLAFVFPGQGAQWNGMACDMIASSPVFRHALERCDAAAKPWIDWSILEQLQIGPANPAYRLDQIDVIQPVLVALAIAYADWLASLGIVPDAVVGHSMGEVGAACVAGVLDLEQAMRIICRRSALMRRTSGQGSMALVDLSMADTQARLRGRESQLSVAASNSPRSSVISGEPAAVQQVLDELGRDGVFCRLVKVDVASHSPQMEPLAHELVAELAGLPTREARVPFYSTVLARRGSAADLGAAYWGCNLRQPVLFSDALAGLLDDGVTVFIELSPHPLLSAAIGQTAQALGREVFTFACGRREEPDAIAAHAAIAELWAAGIVPHWPALLPGEHRNVALPLYPWQRERHWVREASPAAPRGRPIQRAPELADALKDWLHVLRWVQVPVPSAVPAPSARVLIVTAEQPNDQQRYRLAFEARHAAVTFTHPSSFRAALTEELETVTAAVLLADDIEGLPFVAIDMLKALADLETNTGRRVRLTIATRGAQAVDAHPRRRTSVSQAALWGLGRVIAEEHPDLWGGLLDLDPDADAATHADQLAAEVCQRDAERQVAWRGKGRFALRLQASEADPTMTPSLPWPGDGAWLVTGGLGAVALQLAKAMVAQGVRRLILLGRSPLPPRAQWPALPTDTRDGQRVAAVRALEAAGASVHLLVADVADPVELERVLHQYEAEAWPPICGVLHAAGVLETGLATRTDRASFERVYATKVDCAQTLDRLLPAVERFVMISSISAALGIPGMASYAAANAALDALAHDRRCRGLHGLSIQSGAWIDTGMHSGASADSNLRQLQDMGIQGFDAPQGVALFNALAGRPQASITVLPVDWRVFRAARRGRDLQLIGTLGQQELEVDADGMAERLAQAASPLERRRLMEPVVREAIGRVLKLAPARIDARKPLGAMGLNSLMAMELRNRLEAVLARPLSATLAWNYPTLDALAEFLCGDAAPSGAVRPAPTPAPAVPVLADVAELSDQDAAQLLRRKR